MTTLIENTNIIPMDVERVLGGMDVEIAGGRVCRIAPHGTLSLTGENIRIIDGTDQYLMPGLTDCHVHVINPEDFKWYLAYGVTGIVNYMGAARHLTWRRELREGKLLGPDMLTAGPIIDGTAKYLSVMDYGHSEEPLPLEDKYPGLLSFDGVIEARDEETGRQAVRYIREAGYDFVKVYNNLKSEVYYAICDEAEKEGIPVYGHLPDGLNSDNNEDLHRPYHLPQRCIEHVSSVNEETRDKCLEENIAIDCTLTVELLKVEQQEKRPFYQKYMLDIPQEEKGEWEACAIRHREIYIQDQKAGLRKPVKRRGFDYYRMIARTFHERGGLLVCGTDSGFDGLLPGVDMHIELKCLTDCGLSPFEALKTATVNAAAFFRGDAKKGMLCEGSDANLILLERNPLEDIRNVREINGVLKGAVYLDCCELEKLKRNRKYRIYDKA